MKERNIIMNKERKKERKIEIKIRNIERKKYVQKERVLKIESIKTD